MGLQQGSSPVVMHMSARQEHPTALKLDLRGQALDVALCLRVVHLWCDKWTALSGPLSPLTVHYIRRGSVRVKPPRCWLVCALVVALCSLHQSRSNVQTKRISFLPKAVKESVFTLRQSQSCTRGSTHSFPALAGRSSRCQPPTRGGVGDGVVCVC